MKPLKAGASAAIWIARWSICNVLRIKPDGGPIVYAVSLLVVVSLPLWMAVVFIAEALVVIDGYWTSGDTE